MNYRKPRRRHVFANPALAALALFATAAAGCSSSDSSESPPASPFVETYDETIDPLPRGTAAGAGGAGGGTAGTVGKAGAAGAGGSAGKAGAAGAGGFGGFAGGGNQFEGDDKTCSDGLDNDGDKFVDCDDFDCFANPFVTVCGGEGGAGGGSGSSEGNDKACSDGLDNDGDKFVDCDDFDCFANPFVTVCGGEGGAGGVAGGGPGGEGGAGGGSGGLVPSGLWHFDDCSPSTLTLLDSSGNGINALRSPSVSCGGGISGLGVSFNEPGDRIDIHKAPQLTLGQHLTVAAWINPAITDGSRPVVLKRRDDQTAFSLRIQNGQAQFLVRLASGQTVTSSAPIAANQWSHVAGLYDGNFVFLFINGQQVGQIFAQGSIGEVDAPLRVGATTQTQRFVGRIDDVVVSTEPATPFDIQALSCIRRPSELTVNPPSAGPVPAGTLVTYDVSVRNRDFGFCSPHDYLSAPLPPPDFTAFLDPPFAFGVPPGGQANFQLLVSSNEDAPSQVASIPFVITELGGTFEDIFGEVTYEVEASTGGCPISTDRELFIRNLSVVDDPLRTTFNAPPGDPRRGAWTFGRLMTDAAPSPEVAPEFVKQVFDTWLSNQTVNSFNIAPRPFLQQLVLSAWPRLPDGRLDLERSPLQLQGIVNRIDLRDLANGDAGEGRFVFAVLDPGGSPLQFTVILEYKLPASTEADVLDWAQRWHALASLPFPSAAFNDALQEITDRFAGRNAAPGRPNGSALSQLRSNEIALSVPWELREFHFGPDGFLRPATVALTPNGSFNFAPQLAAFVNQNEADILIERHTVPDSFQGAPFATGSILNNIDFWAAPGINNNEARHKFSLNTCNGCHGAETGTPFLHVNPRFFGSEATLSGFMTGTVVADPTTGEPRQLNDLGRRRADLRTLVCEPGPEGRAPANVRKGISRTH